jgi:hypothetical protein
MLRQPAERLSDGRTETHLLWARPQVSQGAIEVQQQMNVSCVAESLGNGIPMIKNVRESTATVLPGRLPFSESW